MDFAFEWFNPILGNPVVTIAEYGLGFNKAAIEALGSPEKVRLGFDKKNKIIAVKASDANDSLALPFASKERSGYVRISSKEFARFVQRNYAELKLEKSIRCFAWYDEKTEALLVSLKECIESETELESETE
ncbi:MAG TPA: hypothetical protein DF698_02495 [Candidatus Atribacteria bacterium]|nr:hypothetical protein [Candidatus Atribacteria bacterium]